MHETVLAKINEIILDEKGIATGIDSKFLDSQLDSLGVMLTLITIDSEYPIFKDIAHDADVVEYLGVQTLTMRELVNKCVLSITDTSEVQN